MPAAARPPSARGRRGLRGWFRDLRVSRKLLVVILVHLLHATVLLVVTAYGMKALSASRAYVEGEGLWSKAQKEGTLFLIAYASSGDESDYEAFLREIDVTLGDRQARLELDKKDPDMAVVRDGFVRGRLSPEDVDDLAWLYDNFAWEPHLAKAIAHWVQGDVEIDNMLVAGNELHEAVLAQDADRIANATATVYAVDARLTILENEFSRDLGDGVRWLTAVVTWGTVGLTVVFVGAALVISTVTARQITGSLGRLRAAAKAVSEGDLQARAGLDGRDEVAVVGQTFDGMTDRLVAVMAESREAEAVKADAAAKAREIQRLGELDAFRADFINTAAHELRTPLTPLRAQLRVLRLRSASQYTEQEKRSLDIAERNVERLASLVEDMLHVSRYQAGRMTLDVKAGDLHRIAAEAVETFEEAAKARGIVLEGTALGDGRTVLDPNRISQVLYNLLGNAVKFTPSGGRIHVTSEGRPDGLILRVTDTGLGIKADDVAKLFQPFSQLHTAEVKQTGSGLGLYICRAIAELHGGTITAESPGPGQGATMTLWLPRRETSAESGAPDS